MRFINPYFDIFSDIIFGKKYVVKYKICILFVAYVDGSIGMFFLFCSSVLPHYFPDFMFFYLFISRVAKLPDQFLLLAINRIIDADKRIMRTLRSKGFCFKYV